MVDAVYLLFLENLGHHAVQFSGAGEIPSERLLDDDAGPRFFRKLRPGQPRRPEVLHDNGEKAGWRGKVEETIAGGAPFVVEPIQQGLQSLVSRGVTEVISDVIDAFAEALHKCVALGGELQILLNRL